MNSDRIRLALGAGAIALAAFVAYLPALSAGFIWDDDDYVTENETLRTADGLRRIWFEVGAVPQYYPITHSTFWLEYQAWGLWSPGYHLDNVILHIAGSLLLWRLLTVLKVPGAWFAAALFALHPVHAESTAWVTERKNVLSGVMYFGSALALTHVFDVGGEAAETLRRPIRWKWYALALALFVAALLAKSVSATLPAAALVVLWWKSGRIEWRNVATLAPFFAVAATIGLNTAAMERWRVGAHGAEFDWSIGERLIVAGRAFWFYLGKLAWPYPVSFNYERWTIDDGAPAQYLWPLAFFALVATLFLARRAIGRAPLAATLFFAGTLFPALGFLNVYPMRYSYVADHFQYLASVGPLAIFAAGCVLLWRGWEGNRAATESRIVPLATAGVAASVLLATLGWRTYEECHAYRDLESLYLDILAKNPDSWFALTNYATMLDERGDDETPYRYLVRAHELYPLAPEPQLNLSTILIEKGRFDEAEKRLTGVVEIAPEYADGRFNLGTLLAMRGEFAGAKRELVEAVRLLPKDALPLIALGRTELALGESSAGLDHLRKALELAPDENEARAILASNLAAHADPAVRNGEEALEQADELLARVGEDDPAALDLEAMALAELGDFAAAQETAARAQQLAAARGDAPFADQVEARRKLYADGKPYRLGP